MTTRPIIRYPDPRLARPAEPVTVFDGALRELARDLLQTMHAAPGIGIMAPRTQKITFSLAQDGARASVRRALTRNCGQGDAVPDDDLVADENILDEKPQDTLAFYYIESCRRRAQASEEGGQRFGQAQVGLTINQLIDDRLQFGVVCVFASPQFRHALA
jgi:Polypeptide deformylase